MGGGGASHCEITRPPGAVPAPLIIAVRCSGSLWSIQRIQTPLGPGALCPPQLYLPPTLCTYLVLFCRFGSFSKIFQQGIELSKLRTTSQGLAPTKVAPADLNSRSTLEVNAEPLAQIPAENRVQVHPSNPDSSCRGRICESQESRFSTDRRESRIGSEGQYSKRGGW